MEAEKDYAFKNEISLSIGEDSADSSASTPSTATPSSGPTPSPRHVNEDTKPLTDKKHQPEMSGIDNKAFESNDKAAAATTTPGKQMSSFGNGHGDSGANKNGQLSDKKLAGETFLHSHVIQHTIHAFHIVSLLFG
jgi:hypothetical protein